jgi:hypothetical protein
MPETDDDLPLGLSPERKLHWENVCQSQHQRGRMKIASDVFVQVQGTVLCCKYVGARQENQQYWTKRQQQISYSLNMPGAKAFLRLDSAVDSQRLDIAEYRRFDQPYAQRANT